MQLRKASDTSTIIAQNNIIRFNLERGVICLNSTNITIDSNLLENFECVACSDNSYTQIINNIFLGHVHAISFSGNSISVLRYNTIQEGTWGVSCYNESTVTIDENLISDNDVAIECYSPNSTVISRNILRGNGVAVGCGLLSNPLIGGKLTDANTIKNSGVAIRNSTSNVINAKFNYWGTTNPSEIGQLMENIGGGSIDYIPFVSNLDTEQIIGDTSGNGAITAYDAALILQYVVGIINKFPSSLTPSPGDGVPRRYSLSIPKVTAKVGEIVRVPILIEDATGLLAGGISLRYDETVLRPLRALPTEQFNGTYWKSNIALENEVRFAFAAIEPMAGSGEFITVEFEVVGTEGITSPLFLSVDLPGSLSVTSHHSFIIVLPRQSRLLQNYPNPFNPETWIPYWLSQDTLVAIQIYNTKGKLIRTLHLGNQNAGIYTTKDKAVYWDGRDSLSEKVASGVYFYTLLAGEFRATRKMVILK